MLAEVLASNIGLVLRGVGARRVDVFMYMKSARRRRGGGAATPLLSARSPWRGQTGSPGWAAGRRNARAGFDPVNPPVKRPLSLSNIHNDSDLTAARSNW